MSDENNSHLIIVLIRQPFSYDNYSLVIITLFWQWFLNDNLSLLRITKKHYEFWCLSGKCSWDKELNFIPSFRNTIFTANNRVEKEYFMLVYAKNLTVALYYKVSIIFLSLLVTSSAISPKAGYVMASIEAIELIFIEAGKFNMLPFSNKIQIEEMVLSESYRGY